MRGSIVVLLAATLVACAGGRTMRSGPRLDRRHYAFGSACAGQADQAGAGRQVATEELDVTGTFPSLEPLPSVVMVNEQRLLPVIAAVDDALADHQERIASTVVGFLGTGRSDEARVISPLDQEEPPARTRWNAFAIASPAVLIAALAIAIPVKSTELLLIGCALALACAIIGAAQCRKKGMRGQGFAMAVMGFAAAGVLISVIALLSRL